MDARYNRVEVGDNVTFMAKGGLQGGTVTRLRIKERRGRIRKLMEMHGVGETMTEVAEILDRNGKGYWTVGLDKLTVVKSLSREEAAAAVREVNQFKNKLKVKEWERKDKAFEVSDQKGLLNLKPGDKITVVYKGGIRAERIFKGFTGTGNIKYLQDGRERFTPPQFVEIPAPVEGQQVVA